MGPTLALASYVRSAAYEDLPDEVVHEAKRSLLNWFGVAIGASRHETVEIAWRVLRPLAGAPAASVLGRTERTDVGNAAFLNGMSSHIFDFDDTHLATIIHPTGPIAPVALALAEDRGLTGQQFLLAFVLGVETECRIGNAVYPEHYEVGWHITGTAGVFGAAAAAAKVLDCDEDRIAQALGLAATQASGLREMFGTMTKSFHVGRAAQSGLFSALLAAEGFTSSRRAIEAPRGFANVLATKRDYGEITDDLGVRFEILKNAYKPYACGIVIHPSIDGCVQLRAREGIVPEEVESVELRVHPYVLELTGKTEPVSGLEGKFSVYHSAAVALVDGAAGEEQYSDARVQDPRVVAVRRKVRATPDPSMQEDAAHIVVTLRNGVRHELMVDHALGSLARPMTDADLEDKFRTLVEPVLGPAKAQELIGLCWGLDQLPVASALARAATP